MKTIIICAVATLGCLGVGVGVGINETKMKAEVPVEYIEFAEPMFITAWPLEK